MLPHRLFEKAECSFLVTMSRQQEIDGLAIPIESTVEIAPLVLDFDIRFIHAPAPADHLLPVFAKVSLQLRRKLPNPAIDTRVIDWHATLCHHFFQVPIAERVSQIPADAGYDDVLFKSVALVDHVGFFGTVFIGRVVYRNCGSFH